MYSSSMVAKVRGKNLENDFVFFMSEKSQRITFSVMAIETNLERSGKTKGFLKILKTNDI